MATQESLSLLHRFELPHPSLSNLSRLMGLLSAIILILLSAVDRFSFLAYLEQNLIHHRRLDSRLTVMPRWAGRSSISRWLRLNL